MNTFKSPSKHKSGLKIGLIVLLTLCVAISFSGCSPRLSSSWSQQGYTGSSFDKVAVVGISKNLAARMEFENSAVSYLKKKGINAVAGLQVFPANMTEEDQRPENLIRLIKKHQLDGVITMSLVDTAEVTRYEPGEDYFIGLGYRRFGDYYIRQYTTIRTPGYYVPSRSYLIEAVIYDFDRGLSSKAETIVWKGQSSVVDPASIKSAAKIFTKKMVMHLIEEQIIRSN